MFDRVLKTLLPSPTTKLGRVVWKVLYLFCLKYEITRLEKNSTSTYMWRLIWILLCFQSLSRTGELWAFTNFLQSTLKIISEQVTFKLILRVGGGPLTKKWKYGRIQINRHALVLLSFVDSHLNWFLVRLYKWTFEK